MKIDEKTMLFEEMSEEELRSLYEWTKDMVQNGNIGEPWPEPVKLWMEKFAQNEDQIPLILKSSLSQKALLSLVESLLRAFNNLRFYIATHLSSCTSGKLET